MTELHVRIASIATFFLTGRLVTTNATAMCRLPKIADVPVQVEGGKPFVPVKINGVDARLMLDTGGVTMLREEAAASLGIAKEGSVQAVGIGGKMQVGCRNR
jgi:hypothetical protein